LKQTKKEYDYSTLRKRIDLVHMTNGDASFGDYKVEDIYEH